MHSFIHLGRKSTLFMTVTVILITILFFSSYAAQGPERLITQWEDTFPSPTAVIQLPKGLDDDSVFDLSDNYEINCTAFPCESSEISFDLLSENEDSCTYKIWLSMDSSAEELKTAKETLSLAVGRMTEDIVRNSSSDSPRSLLETASQTVSESAAYDYGLASLSETSRMSASMHYNRTAYGALVTKKTVCTGYSRAMKEVCNQLDIPCWVIVGTRKGITHSWNAVQLDHQTYYIDCTAMAVGEDPSSAFLFDRSSADLNQYIPAPYSIPPWESADGSL